MTESQTRDEAVEILLVEDDPDHADLIIHGLQDDGVADGLPVVFGDRLRIGEVLQNIIENAAKFMGDEPNPRVEIGGLQRDGESVCFVRDNGMGIDPRYDQKVFNIFDKLDQTTTGTGIGLALVKRIVEVHGGRVWVESEGLGHGSTFYFTLPAKGAAPHRD